MKERSSWYLPPPSPHPPHSIESFVPQHVFSLQVLDYDRESGLRPGDVMGAAFAAAHYWVFHPDPKAGLSSSRGEVTALDDPPSPPVKQPANPPPLPKVASSSSLLSYTGFTPFGPSQQIHSGEGTRTLYTGVKNQRGEKGKIGDGAVITGADGKPISGYMLAVSAEDKGGKEQHTLVTPRPSNLMIKGLQANLTSDDSPSI
jgi:hypothetical protein